MRLLLKLDAELVPKLFALLGVLVGLLAGTLLFEETRKLLALVLVLVFPGVGVLVPVGPESELSTFCTMSRSRIKRALQGKSLLNVFRY